MPPDLLSLVRRQRREIERIDTANLEQIARAYAVMYGRLEGDVDALMLAVAKLENPTVQEVRRLPQYRRLIRDGEDELEDFTRYLETGIDAAALAAITLGLGH